METLHEQGIIHRDLKPKNIMINYSKGGEVTLIDFGLSGRYQNQHGTHIPYKNTKTLLGTPMYASNNALLGRELSRRDDIESVLYIMIFCLLGNLPWSGMLTLDFLQSENAKKRILQMRDPNNFLLREIPLELRSLLDYAQTMPFDAQPDYERIETILCLVKERNNLGDSLDIPMPPTTVNSTSNKEEEE